jgi:hypothetical protein
MLPPVSPTEQGRKMKIGYARLGRLMTSNTDRWGVVGGDCEPPRLLDTLARRHPEDTFYLLGRTPPENPQELGQADNVVNPWIELDESRRLAMSNPERDGSQLSTAARSRFIQWCDENILPLYRQMDAVVVWLGQHGSVHAPGIPKVNGTWDDPVTPQDWAVLYGGLVVRGINAFRAADPLEREEVWLISDARNYLKMHDLKWPIRNPILGQYEFEREFWVQRYGDQRTPQETGFADHVTGTDKGAGSHWRTKAQYVASALEICGILPDHTGVKFADNYDRKHHFGLFINEARATSGITRADVMRDWVRAQCPDWVHGQWTKKGLDTAGMEAIEPLDAALYWPQLQDTRCTFTTPSSGSGWATTKPWEAFQAGSVCFRHPGYDTQDHVYGRFDATAKDWLSPKTPNDLYLRLDALKNNESTWRWLVNEQRRVFDDAVSELRHVKMIEERIWK